MMSEIGSWLIWFGLEYELDSWYPCYSPPPLSPSSLVSAIVIFTIDAFVTNSPRHLFSQGLSDKYFNLKYYSWSLKLFSKCFDFPFKVWTVSVEQKIVVWLKKNNFFEMLILLSQVCEAAMVQQRWLALFQIFILELEIHKYKILE